MARARDDESVETVLEQAGVAAKSPSDLAAFGATVVIALMIARHHDAGLIRRRSPLGIDGRAAYREQAQTDRQEKVFHERHLFRLILHRYGPS